MVQQHAQQFIRNECNRERRKTKENKQKLTYSKLTQQNMTISRIKHRTHKLLQVMLRTNRQTD